MIPPPPTATVPNPAAHRATPPTPPTRPRVALAHDWLCGYRGGEAVLERIAGLLEPRAEIAGLYAMFDDGRPLAPTIDRVRHVASPLNRIPGGRGPLRRWLLPFYPSAVERLGRALGADHARRPIDLLISTSSAAIKGLRPPPGVPHLCYCHAPARYIWSRRADYDGGLRGLGLRLAAGRFAAWDRATAANVTAFLANSSYTAEQVRHCFGREAAVVHPPVRTAYFTPAPGAPREDFWLVVSALEPYKRIDLAIDAARLAGRRLVIAGTGSQRGALERHARGSRTTFAGRVSDEELRRLYRAAALLLFPQVEDFGIVAAEAQACGLPVVARRDGGALDIVIDGITGAFFGDPTPEAVAEAAARIPRDCEAVCRTSAERFAEDRFDAAMAAHIAAMLAPAPRAA